MRLLHAYDVDPYLVDLIKALYRDTKAAVKVGNATGPAFSITTGVRQGCLLSCALFNFVEDSIGRQFLTQCGHLGVLIRGNKSDTSMVTGLLYADDLVLLAHDLATLQRMLTEWDRIAFTYGLVTSTDKTKIVAFSAPSGRITIRGAVIEFVDEFRYLGCLITSDLSWDREVAARISSARKNWHRDKCSVFLNTRLPLQTRVRHFHVTVLVALLYGAEVWTMTKTQTQQLAAVYHCFLRQMLRIHWWQYVSNARVLAIARLPPFERPVASRTLRWLGHLTRMDGARLTATAKDFKVVPPECAACSFPLGKFHFCPATGAPHDFPTTTPHSSFKTWGRQADEAIATAVTHYPFRSVPDWTNIVDDRAAWRTFSSAFDASTSWDASQRQHYFRMHRGGVGDHSGPLTGLSAPLKVFD
jgi:hypothetical protein